jgi:hypothetical protein
MKYENKCKTENYWFKVAQHNKYFSKIKTQSISFWTEKLLYIYKDHDASIIAIFMKNISYLFSVRKQKRNLLIKKYWYCYQWLYL